MTDSSFTRSEIPSLAEMNLDDSSEVYDEEDESLSEFSYQEMNAKSIATNTEYWAVWEVLNGLHEAAYEDIPSRYHDCLSVFERRRGSGVVDGVKLTQDDIFKIVNAIVSNEPWSLAAPVHQLSEVDARRGTNIRIMEVASVIPSATLCYTLESSAKDAFLQDLAILDITSPLLHSHEPSFSSAIFTTASQLSTARISFHALRRYNRMATTSALRQTNALGIDLPVFGILINGNQCVIHIDWLENNDGIIECYSAFYPSDIDRTDFKIWDLANPTDTQSLHTVLTNLQTYTQTIYASHITQRLSSLLNDTPHTLKPWKWDASLLLSLSSQPRIQHFDDSVEADDEKMARWQSSLHMSPLQHEKHWVGRILAEEGIRGVVSPPSPPSSY